MNLNVVTNFCDFWYIAWILPFLLGILFGYFMWAKHAKKVRLLEDELAKVKSKLKTIGK